MKLSEYVTENDVYVNEISVDKDQHKLILNRKNATPLELGLEELSDIGVSSTDYQLVENPTNGSGGKYTVDDNGTLTLTVKDLNNPNAATKPITITGLAKKTDVAVVHGKYREGEANNLVDTNAQILDEAMRDEKSSSIALGKDAFVSVQNGKKANALIFGNDTYTGGIAIGENSKALNATVNIGVKDYKGKMGDVDLSDYKTYEAMGVGETSIGSNSYISGSLSTNVGSYNITTTKYMNGGNPLDSIENFGSIIVGTLNSIESNSSSSNIFDTLGGKISGVANNAIGMANKTQNSNGSLIFGTGNEITNSIDSIPSPVEISDIISDKKNDKDVTEIADSFRDAVSDRSKANGGAVLAIGGGNKADYAQNSQLIGVQNEVTGTSKDISEFNMVNGYQNTVTNGSNDTVIGTKNTVTKGDSNVVLGDNHTVKDANNNVILGSSDKETTHTASNTVVIGYNAQANSNNDVAIGSGSVANGAVKTAGYAGANPIGTVSVGSEGNERTITNVAAGRINEDSTDAVNGSQLYATNQKVDAGWTATDGTTNIAVNPTETGTTTLKFAGDRNIDVTADKASSTINVSLKDNVVLGGKASNDPRVQIGGTNGTIMATKNPNSISATTTIDGGNIYVGSSVSVGANDDVVMTDKDITGLSNTTWDGTTDNASRAATEGQLQAVSNEAGKHTTVTVNGGMTAPEDGSYTHDEEGRLDGNLLLKKTDNNGQTEYDLKLNPDLTLQGEDDSTARVEIGGTNGTIMATKDPNSMTATTTIDGGNVYVGSSVSVGDKVVMTNKDITGLSNTTWDGTTDDVSRAATEGQLQAVSNEAGKHTTVTVNGGMTAPEDGSYTHDGEGRLDGNLLLKKTDNNGQTEYDLKLNPDLTLQGEDSSTARVEIGGTNGTIMATKDANDMAATTTIDGGNVYVGSSISVGDKVEITDKDITGLSNTSWNGTTDDESRAATEGQLKDVSDTVNAGWTATDSNGASIVVNPENGSTLNFAGDRNIDVKANKDNKSIDVSLSDDVVLGGKEGTSRVEIGGTNGTIMATKDPNSMAATTTIDGGNIYAGNSISVGANDDVVITDKDITGLSNTTWDGTTDDESRAATEGQLQMVSDKVTAGWTATDDAGNKINVNPETRPTLNFASGKNITVSANEDSGEVEVSLNDNINLNDRVYINGDPEEGNNTIVDIKSGNTSKEESIFAVEDKGNGSISIGGIDITNVDGPYLAVGDGKLKFYKDGGLSTGNATGTFSVRPDGDLEISGKNSSFDVDAETGNVNAINSSGSAIMMNDDSVALNAGGNGVVASDEGILLNTNGINEDIKLVTKGTSVSVDSNGTTFTNTNTNETTNINGGTINVGDKLMVEEDGSIYATNNNGSTVMINDNGVALNSEGNGVVVSGEGITLNTNGSAVTVDRFNGTTFTNTNTGETTNINGGTITTNTVKGLSNTTWDDELAKQVANSEELQGTAATQGQLQQAVSAVATEAAKQHTTVSGDDNLTVTSKENTNGGTNYQVTLNDDITLGNPKAGNTEGERSFTINTTDPNGYVPESYKTGSGANFIEENGGFMLFATDTRGFGVFGVTAKGSAWAKDFKTYTTDIYGNNTQYSLNEIGDAVAQMSSYYNEENGKSYTVFSRYLNEAEKDNPFVTVDENATRDIPLALRDDGAVLIGATIKGEDFTDNGIRINGEIDDDGNNVATITGLENTTWTPPAPVATFANEGTETSRAATEAQLNDLYGTVVGYNVDTNGVNYGTVTLGGGRTSYDQDTHEGGTVLNNVAYASGTDGSEAVNVDYLKDAISDAAENGSISTSDQHLVANTETGSNGVYKPNDDGNVNLIVSDEKGNSSTITIGDVASKTELDSLKTNVGDLSYSKVQGDDVKDGDSVTTAIGKLDNKIENISGTATDADNNTVTGGKINSDGTISLTQKDKDSIKLEGQLTDSGVVQEGTSFDKETGTITITSQDKYSGETSSVKVEGIASTEVVGATNKEDLATAYKDADKDGNATTEYITDSESMVEADVALDHAIQDVANTGYANDMVLSNRIDSVEKRLGNVEERIDKVGAMAAAIANLRTMGFDPEAPTEIAIGVGQYKSETGIAIGVFHYPNQDFMLSASLSSSGDELMGGIGATWKLGRKSAAERAKDEEARHLEQAEEMKKLAQQEKVKAQAQRHAKLLAERQQASQKNA